MVLKIEMLRCFATVAQSGNLADAADILGRTPSAVSMTLKQIEEHLGEPLFETDRKNSLTALGEFVLEQSERELRQFDNTIEAIEGFAMAEQGRVRIAAVPSVAGAIMPRVISSYIRKFPKVQIEVRDMDSLSIQREISRERVDIGICTANEAYSVLKRQDLISDSFCLVCPEGHDLAASDEPLTWEPLQGHRLIANELSAQISAPASRRLHAEALLRVHNVISILAMVRAGLGITLLPEMTATLLGASGLVLVPLADKTARRTLHLVRKAERPTSPAAREMEHQILATAALFQTGDTYRRHAQPDSYGAI